MKELKQSGRYKKYYPTASKKCRYHFKINSQHVYTGCGYTYANKQVRDTACSGETGTSKLVINSFTKEQLQTMNRLHKKHAKIKQVIDK